ncbi:uncharacterized protein LOC143368354 isoform X2 [Andrena cerasifolii]
MPGIYVRKTKWFDWIQQRENPVLTVPGSYWLCHKNNIYKFIFKYHRTMRNIEKFSFGKELMKVIRRIIKTQPCQGQQFGTSHLLVTYNRIAWTRQDKMFALLKFKERSVAAFSHAFVLTIKIVFSVDSGEQNGNYVMTFPFPDECLIHSDEDLTNARACENTNEEENTCPTQPSENDRPEESSQCDDIEKEVLKSEDKSIRLGNSLIVANSKETFTNAQAVEHTTNCENASKVRESSKVSLEQSPTPSVSTKYSAELDNREKESKHSRLSTEELEKGNRNQSANSTNSMVLNNITNEVGENEEEVNFNYFDEGNIDNNSFSLEEMNAKDIKLPNNNNELLEMDEYGTENYSTQCKAASDINEAESSTVAAINTDSANLPYQYLIEKEIEDAKHRNANADETKNNAKRCNSDELDCRKRKLEEINEKHSTDSTELLTSGANIDDCSYHKKRKHTSDNKASRSSDITDLVMEGLMFTIRQGQDTVAVIEQKTKLEIDEVLENSEKIETKRGEKCLRNSSLLGLENLITMIETPKQGKREHKCPNTIIRENTLKNDCVNKPLLNGTKHFLTDNGTNQHIDKLYLHYSQWQTSTNNASLAGTSFTTNNIKDITNNDRYPAAYVHEYDENNKFVENEDPEYEEEEEDIVPEVLQDQRFQTAVLSFQQENKPQGKVIVVSNKDLLMDDMDTEDSIKFETMEAKLRPLFSKDLLSKVRSNGANTMYKSKFNNAEQHKSSVPKIVSNEIITADQIPSSLQKMLKNRSSVMPTTGENKVDEGSSEGYKMKVCREVDTASNARSNSPALNRNISKDARCLKNSGAFMRGSNESHKESTSSVASKVELEGVDNSENNIQLKEEKPRKQNVNTRKEEQLSRNGIEDVTREFYQDHSYQRKKKDVANQKYLRSKRKSLNTLRDTDDGETRIEMVKFLHDITRGAKVVVRRMSTKNIHSIIEKSSSLAACKQH